MGAGNAKQDLQRYRDGYPGDIDDKDANDNYLFYTNQLESSPHGDYIENILTKWKGNYEILEAHHGYIQWLFPIREHGMNSLSQKLQKHEIEKIRADPQCIERLIRAYELMLDFYGIKLKDKTTGELERASNYKSRYRNLNSSSHNYLRITRILKCLGEFGLESWKKYFIDYMIEEVWVNRLLPNCASSLRYYWVETLRNDEERFERQQRIKSILGESSSSSEDDDDITVAKTIPKRTVKEEKDEEESDAGSEDSEDEDLDAMTKRFERMLDSTSDEDEVKSETDDSADQNTSSRSKDTQTLNSDSDANKRNKKTIISRQTNRIIY